MNGVSEGILPVVAVDRKAAIPLHRQIYDGLRAAIVRRDLRPGQRVPSSRDLASELGVSRIPVLNAYAQLLAEGYLESRVGAGTFVSGSMPDRLTVCELHAPQPGQAVQGDKGALSSSGRRLISRRSRLLPPFERKPWVRGWGAFGVHQPAFDQFPFETWSRLVLRHSRSPRAHALQRIHPLGSERLRNAVCAYLRTARAARCDPEQVMIVAGSQQALAITARVLFDPGDALWIEEPGYWLARNVFTGAGCRLIPVRVDNDGMNVAAGIKQHKKARAAYVTPSHQFPLGTTMSASRRLQLLDWAQSSGSWIIEDDYDSEYRFESMPIASLQGLDSNSRVIYIGTFSKVLFPTLRLGYMVIPPDLLERFVAVRFAMDLSLPYLNQEVVADFMLEGHFARHIRRMRHLYKERRTALVKSIAREFGTALEVQGAEAGMHLVVTLPEGFDDVEFALRAASENLWMYPLSTSYAREKPRHGFILGFGSTPAAQMPYAVRRMRSVLGVIAAR